MWKIHNICPPLAGVLLISGLLGPRVEAQPIGDAPLISIVEPTFNETSNASTIYIGVRFGPGVNTSTFEARLNGNEITSLFNPATECGTAGPCDMRALVQDSDLLNGTNIVTVDIEGPNEAEGSDRTKFQFASPSVAAGSSASRFVSAVGVESVRLPSEADPNDVNSYQIVVGPGPDSPDNLYPSETHLLGRHKLNAGSGSRPKNAEPGTKGRRRLGTELLRRCGVAQHVLEQSPGGRSCDYELFPRTDAESEHHPNRRTQLLRLRHTASLLQCHWRCWRTSRYGIRKLPTRQL